MRFEEVFDGWVGGRLSQEEAAQILGICDRTFRRYSRCYEADGVEGLADGRLGQVAHNRAPVDEVMALADQYRGSFGAGMPGISTVGTVGPAGRAATPGSKSACRAPCWCPRPRNAGSIASAVRVARWQA